MITDTIIEAFFKLIAEKAKDEKNHLASAAKLLMHDYIKYLYELDAKQVIEHSSILIDHINLFRNQPEFSPEHIDAITQDISNQGKAHREMITEDRDIIERLYTIEHSNYSMEHQPIPKELSAGRNIVLSEGVTQNRNALFFHPPIVVIPLANIYRSTLGATNVDDDSCDVLDDPQFLALPVPVQELMKQHPLDSNNFIKYHGLSYEDLQKESFNKLSLIFSSPNVIYILAPKGITIKNLLHFDERKLALLLHNPHGLSVLLHKKITLNEIVVLDDAKFETLIQAPNTLSKLIDMNISFDNIVKLSNKDLNIVLKKNNSPEGVAIEQILIICSQYKEPNQTSVLRTKTQ